jgi:hypothetical protein
VPRCTTRHAPHVQQCSTLKGCTICILNVPSCDSRLCLPCKNNKMKSRFSFKLNTSFNSAGSNVHVTVYMPKSMLKAFLRNMHSVWYSGETRVIILFVFKYWNGTGLQQNKHKHHTMEYTIYTKGDAETCWLAFGIGVLMFVTRAPRTALVTRAQIDRKKTIALVWVAAYPLLLIGTGASVVILILFVCALVQCILLDELIFCSVAMERAGCSSIRTPHSVHSS